MKLNHINLIVSNVGESIHFLERYFGFKCIEVKGDNIIATLEGSDDFSLVLMHSKSGPVNYPDGFHIGFLQDNAESVDNIYNHLITGGFEVGRAPGKIRDSYGFYFTFDNILIEVGYYG